MGAQVRRRNVRREVRRRTILIGVTIDDSLQFHTGLPEALVVDGWEVHVVAGPGRRLERLRQTDGIHVHEIPMRRVPNPWFDFIAFAKWIRLVWIVRPDVTLIGTPKAALLGNLAARILRVRRRIYVLHGLRLETSAGLLRSVLYRMERLTAASAHEVLSVSNSVKRLAVNMALATERGAIVLGAGSCNGVDVARFSAIAADGARASALAVNIGLDRALPTIGFVGRLTRDKGLAELAGAFRILRSEGVHAQVLLVGGVDDESGRIALAELNRTGQSIVAVGYREDPAPFYPLMNVFCLPSLREGLPSVVLEAMASRIVVVGTDATGNVDLIEDKVTGYLVDRGSERQLADALRYAIENPIHSEELAEAAFRMVESRFDTSTVQFLLRNYLLAR